MSLKQNREYCEMYDVVWKWFLEWWWVCKRIDSPWGHPAWCCCRCSCRGGVRAAGSPGGSWRPAAARRRPAAAAGGAAWGCGTARGPGSSQPAGTPAPRTAAPRTPDVVIRGLIRRRSSLNPLSALVAFFVRTPHAASYFPWVINPQIN